MSTVLTQLLLIISGIVLLGYLAWQGSVKTLCLDSPAFVFSESWVTVMGKFSFRRAFASLLEGNFVARVSWGVQTPCLQWQALTLCIQVYLPAQNILSVTLTLVDALQVFWSTIGRLSCCRTVGRFSGVVAHVSFRFPQPVTRPLKPASINLWKEIRL